MYLLGGVLVLVIWTKGGGDLRESKINFDVGGTIQI